MSPNGRKPISTIWAHLAPYKTEKNENENEKNKKMAYFDIECQNPL